MKFYNKKTDKGGITKYFKTILFILCFIITASFIYAQPTVSADTLGKFSQADNKTFSFETEKENIAAVYEKIISIKETGDAENDFSAMLIEYNTGIRALLEREIEAGKDKTLTTLARQTLERHLAVQEILKTYLGKVKLAKNKKNREDEETGSAGDKMQDSLKVISSKVHELKLTKNQEYNFAALLGYHFYGAISLISSYLNRSDDATLEKLAQLLRDENTASVRIIEKWKNSHKK